MSEDISRAMMMNTTAITSWIIETPFRLAIHCCRDSENALIMRGMIIIKIMPNNNPHVLQIKTFAIVSEKCFSKKAETDSSLKRLSPVLYPIRKPKANIR
ncbi:MAG: hypothetical protein K5629_07250 [Eubacteriales bacterium]|nr:hypothetical protein [Eubacteriales bacterium]